MKIYGRGNKVIAEAFRIAGMGAIRIGRAGIGNERDGELIEPHQ